MRALILVAVAAVLVPTSAGADGPRDRFVPCCAEVQEYNWSGLFVGGHAGAAIAQVDWDFATTPPDGTEHDDAAFGGGVQVALQRQWGRMVAGVEVSYTWTDLDDTSGSLVSPGTTFSSSVSDLLIVSGKLGYAQDRWLAFAKAGYATADIELRCTACGATPSSSDREHGWMMGIGMDYALTHNLVLGVEYDWSFFSIDRRAFATGQADGSADVQTIMARLMYRFGWEGPQPIK